MTDAYPKHYQCISCGRRITLEGPWHGRPQGPQCPCNPNSWGNWRRTDEPGTVLYTSPPPEAFDTPRSDAQITAFSGGQRPRRRTLTPETLHEAIEKLTQQDIPQDFKAIFPASCANDCLDAFGGRLVPCTRPTLEAYDEIIEHNEGQGLIILGRRGIGVELKESYYRQAVKNVQMAAKGQRYDQQNHDLIGELA